MADKKEKVEEIDLGEIETAQGTETVRVEETVATDERKGFSIAALVLGICSIVFVSYFLVAVACGVLAIIFGLKGKKRGGKGMAAAGFIMGIIGISLQVVLFIIGFFVGLAIVGALM